MEPQGLACVSRAGQRSHGLCPIHRAARRQASRYEDTERLWRGRGGGSGKGFSRRYVSCRCTLRYAGAAYVLHAFEKKSKTGRETARRDLELVKQRLREPDPISKDRAPSATKA